MYAMAGAVGHCEDHMPEVHVAVCAVVAPVMLNLWWK